MLDSPAVGTPRPPAHAAPRPEATAAHVEPLARWSQRAVETGFRPLSLDADQDPNATPRNAHDSTARSSVHGVTSSASAGPRGGCCAPAPAPSLASRRAWGGAPS